MNRHLSVALVLCTLALAGCQSAQGRIAASQTQAVQSAFDRAVAAAQTQAAQQAQAPVTTPIIPLAADMEEYLRAAVEAFKPTAMTFQGQLTSATYRADNTGNPVHLDVALSVSDDTKPSLAYATVLQAFNEIYSDPQLEGLVFVPETLETFTIVLYDLSMKQTSSTQGKWADVVAFGRGELAPDQFMNMLAFATAAP